MSNPLLTDNAFRNRSYSATDNPEAMTVGGVATIASVMFVALFAAAGVGWRLVKVGRESVEVPTWIYLSVVVGFVLVLVAHFKPLLSRYIAPVYAIVEGLFVGAISRVYEFQYSGIVLQAVGATLAVFAVTLVLYRTRIVKVTDRFRRVVIAATAGLMLFYLVSFLLHFAGVHISFMRDATPLGIAFSVFAAGLAAFNLFIDFDFIERNAKRGTHREMEWFASLALMVTVVWLYFELLRLFAKLNRR